MKAAIWLRFRSEVRARWRALVGLGLLIGVGAGVVVAFVAGAERTDDAYERFLEHTRAMDIAECSARSASRCDLDALASTPGVTAIAPFTTIGPGFVYVTTLDGRGVQPDPDDPNYVDAGEILVLVGDDRRFGEVVQRQKILDGRVARPRRVDEATVNFSIAEHAGIGVGDRLRLRFLTNTGAAKDEVAADSDHTWTMKVRVVGVEVAPLEVPPPSGQWEAGIHLTPAFLRQAAAHNVARESGQVGVRIDDQSSVGRVNRSLREHDVAYQVGPTAAFTQNVQPGIQPQVTALLIMGAVTALAVFVVFGAVLVRAVYVDSFDVPTLRALGMHRAALTRLGMMRGVIIGAVASVAAAVTAVTVSPLMPIGLARTVELEPGFEANLFALGVGALVTLGIVVLVATYSAWRVARQATGVGDTASARRRPSTPDALARRVPLTPSATTGIAMALDTGSGEAAVPIRSSILAIATAIVVVTGALVFSNSLGHLVETPRLVGWNWDVVTHYPYEMGPDGDPALDADGEPIPIAPPNDILAAFARHPGVRDVASGLLSREYFASEPALELGPGHVGVEVFSFGPGTVGPTVISGRAPAAADEILVGSHTLDDLDAHVGDRVRVATIGLNPVTQKTRHGSRVMRIVGTGVVPIEGGDGRLGRGATLTLGGMRALNPVARPDTIVLRIAPGADAQRVVRDVLRSLHADTVRDRSELLRYKRLGGVATVETVDDFPLILAVLMIGMAIGVAMHALMATTRRRRHDLAVLATLGFTRRQLRRTIRWEATVLIGAALVVAVPIGIVAGRLTWKIYAEGLGVASEPVVSAPTVVALIVGALLVAVATATLPGRAAARTRPSAVLRAE